MFRTRDFILLFSAIMFLVMAIGTTLINQSWSQGGVEVYEIDPETDSEYVATVVHGEEITRAQRIAQMRSKISQQALLTEEFEDVVVEEEQEDVVATSTDEQTDVLAEVRCPAYRPYTTFWDARDLSLVASEGAIVLTRGEVSSTSIPEVVMQLPARTVPGGNPSCISTDVIGIANDGSLIRNDEVALYGIFSADTLIGYALDGFPIYGTGTDSSDACGGLMAAGGYRYQLSAERETIINCFAAVPALLP